MNQRRTNAGLLATMMLGVLCLGADASPHWAVMVWTDTGVADGWPLPVAQAYCDRLAEGLAARWPGLRPPPEPAYLRMLVERTGRITIQQISVNNRPLRKVGDAALEEAIMSAMPPLNAPLSPSGYRMFLLELAPEAPDKSTPRLLRGRPTGASPVAVREPVRE